jgi:toxin CcdB
MARLDVYPMPGRGAPGYVVDVRARLLDHLATRAVVPLLAVADAPPPIKELNPVFDIEGAAYVMLTQAIASIPAKELKRTVASLDSQHDQITRALDVLLLGF